MPSELTAIVAGLHGRDTKAVDGRGHAASLSTGGLIYGSGIPRRAQHHHENIVRGMPAALLSRSPQLCSPALSQPEPRGVARTSEGSAEMR